MVHCHICNGSIRFTVLDNEPVESAFAIETVGRTGLTHCRLDPAHSVDEPYLTPILWRRRDLSDQEWETNDSFAQ